MAEVVFQNVNKSYGHHHIVKDLNLTLPDGSLTVLVGPSGCGKSTSLRMLAGLEDVSSGRILIGGKDVTDLEPKDRDIAMVFQNYALYPHLTVRENIGFPLKASHKLSKAEFNEKVEEIAEALGLQELLSRRPKDLSGGQQQRVAIGRAIIRKPAVFLFDEPLSNLDAKLRVETRSELLQIQRGLGITSLYVTHDQEEAMTLSDRMIVMDKGQIIQNGTPQEVFAKPNSVFVATFVGSPKTNMFSGKIFGGRFVSDSGNLEFSTERPDIDRVQVGIRPDDFVVVTDETTTAEAPDEGSRNFTIDLIELLGPRAIITLTGTYDLVKIVVEEKNLGSIKLGQKVGLHPRKGKVLYFSEETGTELTA